MGVFAERLRGKLAERERARLYRRRLTLDSAQGPEIEMTGRRYINFCSNDYLGLAAHPRVCERLARAVGQYGTGSGASHLVCGHLAPHHELEEALAEFTGRERALLFSSGYMANAGVMSALLERGDCVLHDRLNHASLLDAGLASGARIARYPHSDLTALEQKLQSSRRPTLVAVDGVFSMDGDEAPLPEMAALCAQHDAWLMVDDAHGFGINGPDGAGTVAKYELGADQVPVLMATLGKALGTAGAFVAGSELLIESLTQFARNYIYTTALPPAVAAATLEALEIVRSEPWRRAHLATLTQRFRAGAQELGWSLPPSTGAIQPLLVGEADAALQLSEQLRERGFLISAIRPPTVPAGTSRLRVTLTAAHSDDQVDLLLQALSEIRRA